MGKYSGKKAVITGGGSGVGFAMERRLVALVADPVDLVIIGEPVSREAREQVAVPVALGENWQRPGNRDLAHDVHMRRLVGVVPARRGPGVADGDVAVGQQDRDEQQPRRPGAEAHVAGSVRWWDLQPPYSTITPAPSVTPAGACSGRS